MTSRPTVPGKFLCFSIIACLRLANTAFAIPGKVARGEIATDAQGVIKTKFRAPEKLLVIECEGRVYIREKDGVSGLCGAYLPLPKLTFP